MRIEFDHEKDTANLAKHGVSLALASDLEWRARWCGRMPASFTAKPANARSRCGGDRVYFAAFVIRAGVRRMISLRKANEREVRRYAQDD